MEINQELLINLIKERAVLWDKTIEEYKNKRFTYDAWKDLCALLEPSFIEMDPEQQNNFGKSVMKKWTNMRDSWMKYSKKQCMADSGSKPKKYVFYEQMSFLKKLGEPQSAVSTELNISNDSSCTSNEAILNHVPKKRRKRFPESNDEEFEERLNSLLASREQERQSRVMNFFKSIAPSVDSFTDDQVVEFQFQVMGIIKNIKSTLQPVWNQGYQIQNDSNASGYNPNEDFQPIMAEIEKKLLTTLKPLERSVSEYSLNESNDSLYSTTDIDVDIFKPL